MEYVWWCLVFASFTMTFPDVDCFNTRQIVYQLASVDFEWKNESERQGALSNGYYVIQNNIITGIKVFKEEVFVTVPRWRSGIPSTLNVLVTSSKQTTILRPFPSWEMNKRGDCKAFQYVQSMEVDPNTGYMWIIDTGKGLPVPSENNCPPKLVVMEIVTNRIVRTYIFPPSVVSPVTNFMNDIVLDYVGGQARYAYITDTRDAKLYVYDYVENTSYSFKHETMKAQPLIRGLQDDLISAAVDGIAMSADFLYVYYSPLTSHSLYAIPAIVLRNQSSNFADHVIFAGNKTGGSDGMVCGQKSLFYTAFEENAVYKANVPPGGVVSLAAEDLVVSNSSSVVWVDTFAFNGTDLWFVANKLNVFSKNMMDFSGNVNNMFIWKIDVGENSYLYRAMERTAHSTIPGIVG